MQLDDVALCWFIAYTSLSDLNEFFFLRSRSLNLRALFRNQTKHLLIFSDEACPLHWTIDHSGTSCVYMSGQVIRWMLGVPGRSVCVPDELDRHRQPHLCK